MSYCFLDIETTGLDPLADHILEIGWIFTNRRLQIIGVPKTFVVEHDSHEWHEVWSSLSSNPYVMNMHKESGLYEEMRNGTGNRASLDNIYDHLLVDVLNAKTLDGIVHLAGFSVGFDKSFLVANDFSRLFDTDGSEAFFHHRVLDLSSFKLLLDSADIDVPETENLYPHRALYDAQESLNFARASVSLLQGVTL